MSEGAEAAIADEHVARLQARVEPGSQAHVVAVQGRGEGVEQHAGACVEEDHQMGHREAAAGLGLLGLAEVGLELGRVGHREGRAVDEEGAMSAPEPHLIGIGSQRLADASQEPLEDGQRQPCPCLTEGRGGEGLGHDPGQMGQRRVAVEDLSEEELDSRKRVEGTRPPVVVVCPTFPIDCVAVEGMRQVLAEPLQGG